MSTTPETPAAPEADSERLRKAIVTGLCDVLENGELVPSEDGKPQRRTASASYFTAAVAYLKSMGDKAPERPKSQEELLSKVRSAGGSVLPFGRNRP